MLKTIEVTSNYEIRFLPHRHTECSNRPFPHQKSCAPFCGSEKNVTSRNKTVNAAVYYSTTLKKLRQRFKTKDGDFLVTVPFCWVKMPSHTRSYDSTHRFLQFEGPSIILNVFSKIFTCVSVSPYEIFVMTHSAVIVDAILTVQAD